MLFFHNDGGNRQSSAAALPRFMSYIPDPRGAALYVLVPWNLEPSRRLRPAIPVSTVYCKCSPACRGFVRQVEARLCASPRPSSRDRW
jgi:hypothetical protein